jgi:excisionase family DNA binding protein
VSAPAWLRASEAAAHCRCSAKTLLKEVHAGHLRAFRIGSRRGYLFRLVDLDAWLTSRELPVVVAPRGAR